MIKAQALLLSLCTLLIFVGCRREDLKPSTFTLRGRLVEGCQGTPVVGTQLYVEYRTAKLTNNTNVHDIGRGVTDSQGYFIIICQNQGNGKYTIEDLGGGGVWLDQRTVRPTANGVEDVGDLRRSATYDGVVKVRTSPTRSGNDTLIMGVAFSNRRQIVLSASGEWTERFEYSETLGGQRNESGKLDEKIWVPMRWAIGARVYDALPESPLIAQQQNVNVPFHLCQAKDTFEIFLP